METFKKKLWYCWAPPPSVAQSQVPSENNDQGVNLRGNVRVRAGHGLTKPVRATYFPYQQATHTEPQPGHLNHGQNEFPSL